LRRLAVPVVVFSLLLAACDSVTRTTQVAPATSATSPPAPVVLGDYDSSADARADLEKALAAAAQDGKPVLVDFGATWCPDCVMLGRLGTKPQVAPLLAEFHVVSVDVGRFDRNLDIAHRLTVNLQTSGIPALVVLDAKDKVRTTTNDGSFSDARTMTPSDFAAFLKRWQ
jgi:thioredoxin 1